MHPLQTPDSSRALAAPSPGSMPSRCQAPLAGQSPGSTQLLSPRPMPLALSQPLPPLPSLLVLLPVSRQHLLRSLLLALAPCPAVPGCPPRPWPVGQRVTWCSAPTGCGPWGAGAGAGKGRVGRCGGRCDNSGSCARALGADGAGERDEAGTPIPGSLAQRWQHGGWQPPAPPPCALHPLGTGWVPVPRHSPVVFPAGLGRYHTGSRHQPHGTCPGWGDR